MGLSSAVALLLWFLGPLLVRSLGSFADSQRVAAAQAIQLAGPCAAILIFQRTLVGIQQAFNRYAVINALDFVQAVLTNLGFLVVAAYGGRTVALMKWQLLASVVVLAVSTYVVITLARTHKLCFGWSGKHGRQIFRYSLATWAATLGSAAFGQCDRLLVGWTLGAPLLGVYSAITNVTSKINSLSAAAVQPLVPSLSRDLAVGTIPRTRIQHATRLNALAAIGLSILLYLSADWVMRLLSPDLDTRQNIIGLECAAVIYGLYSLSAPGYFILFASGGVRTNAVVVLFSGIVALLLIVVGARHFGLLGAIAGNAGYLASLMLVIRGLGKTKITVSSYLRWMTVPLLYWAIALVAGGFVQGHPRL